MTPPDALDAIMSLAVARPGSGGGFIAYIEGCAHAAFADGLDASEALTRLRTTVAADLAAVMHSLEILTGRAFA